MAECAHDELYFGSGGYYVFCKSCAVGWVAINADHTIDVSAGARATDKPHDAGSFKWTPRTTGGQ
jgi:hypothetical protein